MKTRVFIHALTVMTAFCVTITVSAQQEEVSRTNTNLFRQLGTELPTPNVYRTASGAPGHEYWQQKVDYNMHITLNDNTQRIDGSETITYTNNSPDVLRYFWVQLDQNVRSKDSDSHKIRESSWGDKETFSTVMKLEPSFEGGFNIESVKDASGSALNYTISNTMMRV
ncbi:MAG: M1 family peptidase, partial [Flavobacteriales bacterium]